MRPTLFLKTGSIRMTFEEWWDKFPHKGDEIEIEDMKSAAFFAWNARQAEIESWREANYQSAEKIKLIEKLKQAEIDDLKNKITGLENQIVAYQNALDRSSDQLMTIAKYGYLK